MKAVTIILVALAFAAPAAADNWPHPTLDAVASSVAGHPTTAWCEDSWGDWIHAGDYFGEDWSFVQGFTYLERPAVYLAPNACQTLHALLDFGPGKVGTFHAASALLTLIHEGVHQRGVRDEGETDCAALTLVEPVAVGSFGYAQTVSEPYTQTVKTRKKIRGRWVTVVSTRVAYRSVPNPVLTDLKAMAVAWHKAKPPAYQGTC